MNTDITLSNSASPSAVDDRDVTSTTAPDPLSQTAVTSPTVKTVPSTGNSRCRTIACSPWTSIAGLKLPMLAKAPEASPNTTAWVGYARWSTFIEFSVVNAKSLVPPPIPTAYSSESFVVHDDSVGALVDPTALGLMAIRPP